MHCRQPSPALIPMQRLCDWVKGRSISVSYIYIYIYNEVEVYFLLLSICAIFQADDMEMNVHC